MENEYKPNVLIVDDDPTKLKISKEILNDMDINIMETTSGNEAFRLLMKNDFALIILDVKMPGINGFEIAELVRKRGKFKDTPILFVTSYGPDELDVQKGYSLGSVDYIFAPINPEILRSKVSMFVKLAQLEKTNMEKHQQVDIGNKELKIPSEEYEELKRTNERLDFIFNSMPVVLFTLKPTRDFEVTFITRNTLEELGYESTDFMKNPGLWIECIHSDDMEQIFTGFSELFDKGNYTCMYRFKCKSGEYIWVQNTLKLINEDNGNLPVEIIGCLSNISKMKLAEEQLLRKKEELERSNADLENFAYIASHDLQEPLRAISSYIQLIQRKGYIESLDDKGKDYFSRVINGAKRMQNMIDDLLRYSRIISDKSGFEPCDCNTIIKEAIDNLQVLIKESEAEITYGVLPVVDGNKSQLLRVFQNILNNGLKFHKEGEKPIISVEVEKKNSTWLFSFKERNRNKKGITENDI